MQLALPFNVGEDRLADGALSTAAPSPPASAKTTPSPPVLFIRHPRARRYVIRLRPDGSVRVTIPRRGSKREAEAFLIAQQPWLERQRRRLAHLPPSRVEWHVGSAVYLDGVPLPLEMHPGDDGGVVTLGRIAVPVADGTTDLRRVVERALWAQARAELPARLQLLANRHGVREVARVSVRNQQSRWGSAGPNGHVTLNWRLIQMPPEVRDYVLIHELMHVRQPDHSAAFWKLVAAACPHWRDARRWLQQFGRAREDEG